jgi:hypothetical protein
MILPRRVILGNNGRQIEYALKGADRLGQTMRLFDLSEQQLFLYTANRKKLSNTKKSFKSRHRKKILNRLDFIVVMVECISKQMDKLGVPQ